MSRHLIELATSTSRPRRCTALVLMNEHAACFVDGSAGFVVGGAVVGDDGGGGEVDFAGGVAVFSAEVGAFGAAEPSFRGGRAVLRLRADANTCVHPGRVDDCSGGLLETPVLCSESNGY